MMRKNKVVEPTTEDATKKEIVKEEAGPTIEVIVEEEATLEEATTNEDQADDVTKDDSIMNHAVEEEIRNTSTAFM
eukprot:15355387-Ditylum_brightwellii.AAC.1